MRTLSLAILGFVIALALGVFAHHLLVTGHSALAASALLLSALVSAGVFALTLRETSAEPRGWVRGAAVLIMLLVGWIYFTNLRTPFAPLAYKFGSGVAGIVPVALAAALALNPKKGAGAPREGSG